MHNFVLQISLSLLYMLKINLKLHVLVKIISKFFHFGTLLDYSLYHVMIATKRYLLIEIYEL